ncbi:MAG: flagellar basal body L-ring protein FlgH [Proteobacteria bacterium]|nr:flagellar basal body L-ring protein FlgH [Pseudomonadota bacterium]
MKRVFLMLLLLSFLSACVSNPLVEAPEQDPPVPVIIPPAAKAKSGGVFTADTASSWLADSRAFRAGDVLTVVLQETTQASKKAGTNFDKSSGVDIKPTILGTSSYATNVGVQAKRDFAGSSSSTQQNMLSGAITVVVEKVLPNGLLLIRGEKQLSLNQGEESIRLVGYVRSDDIDSDNRVMSPRVANARISYSGKGALNDVNTAGWLTRLFNSPWMPF